MRAILATSLLLLALAAPASAAGPGAPPIERTRESGHRGGATEAPQIERTRERAQRGGAGSTAAPGGPVARAALSAGQLESTLRGPMRSAGGGSGAAVMDLTNERSLFQMRSNTLRTPASVEKLYTTSTALLRYGSGASLETSVAGVGAREGETWNGDLYLHGAGDPTFGSLSFTRRAYGTGATTYALAQQLESAGIERVDGRVLGDDSVFDGFRGVPDSGLRAVSPYVGPLSGLSYDRGGSARFAAMKLKEALKARKIVVTGRAGTAKAPSEADELASVDSPPMSTIARLTNRPSDNFFAETLIKGLGAQFGSEGSTAAGAGVVRSTVARFDIRPRVIDGSGLSRGNRTTPGQVVGLLRGLRADEQEAFEALRASLPVAGRSGTLYGRMRGSAAQGRCQAKTGTLSNVSALAGYCETQGGETVAFAFLMNGVNVGGARSLQDRMVASIARYDADS